MGVPAFFRWLSRKYPSIVVSSVEEKPETVGGVKVPVDTTKPNPLGIEFDNLYLDMNGIVHPCCHPEHRPAPRNEDEMMVAIFEYIDRLMVICRPRRLLYMAIDGVAPRAKMNQQRSRRFRSSKEGEEKIRDMSRIRAELEAQGVPLPPPKADTEHFDSNCITPGTPFMRRLAESLRYYIHSRLNTDPGWKKLQVILSDANVPGEGEHKIMDYIRKQRASPSHDPNTQHLLCGADADLIMLGLATHEANFTIIREEFVPGKPRPCDLCGQCGHELKDCQGLAREETEEFGVVPEAMQGETDFIFIRLPVLREYLAKELEIPNLPFPFDLERAIDDWVFMCFFVGNDFLPHLPSLEIRENAIDRLIRLYKKVVFRTGGFLTKNGLVYLERVQLILSELGEMEDEIFRSRQQNELNFRARNKDRRRREKTAKGPAFIPNSQFTPVPIGSQPRPFLNPRQTAYQIRTQSTAANADAAKQLKSMLRPAEEGGGDRRGAKRKHDEVEKKKAESSDEEEPPDDIRLWETGWKERYYQAKFEVSADDFEFRRLVAEAYVQGLCWVLLYYYQGCPDWKWFFPFHYAPFSSDFLGIDGMKVDFDRDSRPFKPMEQLMGVFPAGSRAHVPSPWRPLMMEDTSPIIDFYPDNFQIDLNGKKWAWQGVALLPFVEEGRLRAALEKVYPLLTAEERERNEFGCDRLFVSGDHRCYQFLMEIYKSKADGSVAVDSLLTYGMAGVVERDLGAVMPSSETVPAPVDGVEDLLDNRSLCVKFQDPFFEKTFIFEAERLKGAKTPPPTLRRGDWTERGARGGGRGYRPQIGFTRNVPQASFGDAGRRMIRAGTGDMSNMPPPRQDFHPPRGGGRGGRGGGGWSGSRGGGGGGGGGYGGGSWQGGSQQQSYRGSWGGGQQQQQRAPPPQHWQQMMQQQQGPPSYQQPYQQHPPPYQQGGWGGGQQQRGGGDRRQPYGAPPQQNRRGRPSAADYF